MSSGAPKSTIAIDNLTRKRVLAGQIRPAGDSAARRRGLLEVTDLEAGGGIWINPCEAVHTFGMKMNLDVIFLDSGLRVKKIVVDLRPNRIAFCFSARSVLEVKAGIVAESGLECGDQLAISESAPAIAKSDFVR